MLRRQRSFWRRFPSFLVFQRCWQLEAHRRTPLLSFFSCFSAVLTAGGAPPGTSAFLLFLLFSGAGDWACTVAHHCFSTFLAFQRCWLLGVHHRAPLLSFFSCFSAVLTAGGAPPGTSASLLFLLFSGVGNLKRTAEHLCFPSFLAFQRC